MCGETGSVLETERSLVLTMGGGAITVGGNRNNAIWLWILDLERTLQHQIKLLIWSCHRSGTGSRIIWHSGTNNVKENTQSQLPLESFSDSKDLTVFSCVLLTSAWARQYTICETIHEDTSEITIHKDTSEISKGTKCSSHNLDWHQVANI